MLIKPDSSPTAKIIVVGVGGAGCNAVNTMISMDIQNVTFVAMNTDRQALDQNLAPNKIILGQESTKGLGAGGNWEIGKMAAEEDIELIHETLAGADMVFVTAGMGGGTGTGAAPVVSGIAKGLGALTVGVVYQPFLFEGRKRAENAKHGLSEMKEKVDTLITIPNQKILETIDKKISFIEAMKKGDDVLGQAIKSISDIITVSGFINVDFADVKSVMKEAGSAVMGMGVAMGEDRAVMATRAAVSSPLLDLSIGGAKNALVSITGNRDLSMHEISDVMEIVQQYLSDEAHVIVGAAIDDNMDKDIKVTVLATGFNDKAHNFDARFGLGVSMPSRQTSPLHTQSSSVVSQPQSPQPSTNDDDDRSHVTQPQNNNDDDNDLKPQQSHREEENNNSNEEQQRDNDNHSGYSSLNFKKNPNKQSQFPEVKHRNNNDNNPSDEEITQIPAFLRRGFGKKN